MDIFGIRVGVDKDDLIDNIGFVDTIENDKQVRVLLQETLCIQPTTYLLEDRSWASRAKTIYRKVPRLIARSMNLLCFPKLLDGYLRLGMFHLR